MHGFFYFPAAEFHAFGSCHPLIFHIIFPVNNSNYNAFCALNRLVYSQEIHILLLLVTA